MKYMKNNTKGRKFTEVRVRCMSCKTTWLPYGRSGVSACSNCGQAIFGRDPRRGLFESSLMIERIQ
jgi:predicted RNA-binding Zn-ribbon protein involved in translation (DUF1610 family)